MTEVPEGDLRPLIDQYHPPPAFPVESVWAGIEAAEGESNTGARPNPVWRRAVNIPVPWAAAAAVMLFVGGAAAATVLVDPAPSHRADAMNEVDRSSASLDLDPSTNDGARQVIWF